MSLSPTQRTIRALKNQGVICAVVEKWNPHVGPHGIRQDLFGIIDVLALDPESGVRGIQCCAGSGFTKHWTKLTVDNAQASYDWLSTPGTSLEIWAWRKLKVKRGGKAMVWQPRIKAVTLSDFGDVINMAVNAPNLAQDRIK